MRKRSIKIMVRLNEMERKHLVAQVKKSGLSQEALIRSLLNGYAPKPLPQPEYYTMMRELHAIGNNLNQLAAKAHVTGHVECCVSLVNKAFGYVNTRDDKVRLKT